MIVVSWLEDKFFENTKVTWHFFLYNNKRRENPKRTWKTWTCTCTKPLAPNNRTNVTSWPIATIIVIGKGLEEITENYGQAIINTKTWEKANDSIGEWKGCECKEWEIRGFEPNERKINNII